MPLDYNHKDEIILGKYLIPGDCVRTEMGSHGAGIITATTFVEDERGKELKGFYEDHHAIELYDINCPCDGGYTIRLDPEKEFKIVRSRKDILYIYEKIEYQLLSRSADLLSQSSKIKAIKRKAVTCMNNRCDAIKKVNNATL